MAFSELLARSSFSFLQGASEPAELVQRAQALGLTSMAICDRNGLYGAVRAWVAAKELDMPLHVGAELSLSPFAQTLVRGGSPASDGKARYAHFARPALGLLVHDHPGYQHLCSLLTQAHAGLPKGDAALDYAMLEGAHEGLSAVLPVQLGEVGVRLQPWLERLGGLFDGRGYIACCRRFDGADAQRVACAERWSRQTGFPIIATGAPSYHDKSRRPLADILQCIREGTTLDAAGTRLQANAEAYLRSERSLRQLFRERPGWVDNTQLATQPLKFTLSELSYQFPCGLEPGETADEKLARTTWSGAGRRYPHGVPDEVVMQLRKELHLISKLNVAAYFLCTWEIVEIARSLRILCQGRGSAANSAVCYVLGITAVDPARSSLLFERFLSEERAEPPDIDIDFEHERREEVIQAIYARYGRDRAAMVSAVIAYRGKSALREVGKVFGFSLEQVDQLSQSITHWDSASLCSERLAEYGLDASDRRLQQTIEWAQALEGMPRHLSVHVGGFVLSQTPLSEIAPVEPAAMAGRTVIPWDKDDIEALGFFKVDVLGLGMLTAIRKTLELLWADGHLRRAESTLPGHTSPPECFDPLDTVARVPPEDPAVYAMVSEADTVGVFQIESRAQMAMLPRLRPQRFYDLVVEVALVRPGPIQGGMVHPYLRRRNGEEPISVPHDALWPILKRTLGVPLFQEQVMQLSIVGAGYTAGQADQLRRDMAAWKKTGRLLRHRDQLIEGFMRKGIAREFGEALFEQIKGFGDYGFPESHAASFALLVYLSAWQKAHFPAQFTCALINSQPMGFYSASSLVRDAKRHGVTVLPVDVQVSQWDCTVEGPLDARWLRLGFRLVKGVALARIAGLLQARAEASFVSIEDLRARSTLQRDEIEALAEAGALEGLIAGRRQALWAAKGPEGGRLFNGASWPRDEVALPALGKTEQLVLDYKRVGLSISDHPLCHLRRSLGARGALRAEQLRDVKSGTRVSVAGLVLSRQRPGTAAGVVFVTLEDESGVINLVIFARVFERYRWVARHSSMLWVEGKLEQKVTLPKPGEVGRATPVIHLIVEHLESLDSPARNLDVRSRDFH